MRAGSRIWRANMAALVPLAAALLIVSSCSRQTEAPPEVLLSELVQVEGRLHRGDDPEPFTGVMAEYYPDGSTLKSRSELAAGRLEGISEGWHPNGVLQVREHFVEGISHGLRTRWHANGMKASEMEMVDGKLHGALRRWHENGVLAEETQMYRGEPHGDSVAYFESGYVRAHAKLLQGRIVEQSSWQDGERQSEF
jgi:antitoxin component YwqK of YwqJK toxin-antitoxin module